MKEPQKSSLAQGLNTERQAWVWLQAQCSNLNLLQTNYRLRLGEIDLILEERSRAQSELVFVEVRGRQKGNWVDALESVDRKKRRRLKRAIARYLVEYRGRAVSARVDLVLWDGAAFQWIKNIAL